RGGTAVIGVPRPIVIHAPGEEPAILNRNERGLVRPVLRVLAALPEQPVEGADLVLAVPGEHWQIVRAGEDVDGVDLQGMQALEGRIERPAAPQPRRVLDPLCGERDAPGFGGGDVHTSMVASRSVGWSSDRAYARGCSPARLRGRF